MRPQVLLSRKLGFSSFFGKATAGFSVGVQNSRKKTSVKPGSEKLCLESWKNNPEQFKVIE